MTLVHESLCDACRHESSVMEYTEISVKELTGENLLYTHR